MTGKPNSTPKRKIQIDTSNLVSQNIYENLSVEEDFPELSASMPPTKKIDSKKTLENKETKSKKGKDKKSKWELLKQYAENRSQNSATCSHAHENIPANLEQDLEALSQNDADIDTDTDISVLNFASKQAKKIPTKNRENQPEVINFKRNEAKEKSLPPFFIQDEKADWFQLRKVFMERKLNFKGSINSSGIKINVFNEDSYRAIQAYLNEKEIQYHTFKLKSDKPVKVVIRHLPVDTQTEEIMSLPVEIPLVRTSSSVSTYSSNWSTVRIFFLNKFQNPFMLSDFF